MPRPLYASELLAAQPVWLLEFAWAGRTFRFASQVTDIVNEDGDSLPYSGALGVVEMDEAFDLFQDSPSLPSVSLELRMPEGVSVSGLIAQGHSLDGVPAELAIHLAGALYEHRSVRLTGRLTQPTYGADDEVVSVSLESLPFEDGATWPPPSAVVNETTWPLLDSAAEGKYYPTVWGHPGLYTSGAGTSSKLSAVPCRLVQTTGTTNYLLIAGHHVEPGSVRIVDSTTGDIANLTVINTTDGLGQEVAVVDLAADPGAPNATEGDEYWAKFTQGFGGMMDFYGAGALAGAGDLIRWLLEKSSLTVDVGRVRSAAPLLNHFRLAGYIDAAVTPYQYLAQVVELLPVSMVAGASGVYPLVWRMDAGPEDAIEALEVGPRLVRDGPVTYADNEIANEIRIEYALLASKTEHRGKLTITGEEVDGSDPDLFSTVYSRVSRSRYGVRSKVITTDIVYDRATAAAILKWQARAYGLAQRTVTYAADISLAWLGRGQVVTITDPEINFEGQMALVQMVGWRGSGLTLTLSIIENPPLDSKL